MSFDADKPSTETVKRVDWIGASLITVGLVLIMFVLGQGELAPQGWKTPCETAPTPYNYSANPKYFRNTRYHCASCRWRFHGFAVPGLGAIPGTGSR